jgi:hypothetical protein
MAPWQRRTTHHATKWDSWGVAETVQALIPFLHRFFLFGIFDYLSFMSYSCLWGVDIWMHLIYPFLFMVFFPGANMAFCLFMHAYMVMVMVMVACVFSSSHKVKASTIP